MEFEEIFSPENLEMLKNKQKGLFFDTGDSRKDYSKGLLTGLQNLQEPFIDEDGFAWQNFKPIDIAIVMKHPRQIIKMLYKDGYKLRYDGMLIDPLKNKPSFNPEMFLEAGKPREEWAIPWTVIPGWIEEKEIFG